MFHILVLIYHARNRPCTSNMGVVQCPSLFEGRGDASQASIPEDPLVCYMQEDSSRLRFALALITEIRFVADTTYRRGCDFASPEICLIVKEVVEAEGDIEYEKAKTRCCVQADGGKIIIDKFKTPYEVNVLVYDRDHFSRIIIADDSPGFAMI
jgi:hypothetical protein